MEQRNENDGNDKKGNQSIRERLLSRLPQPENLAAYREEVASRLAKRQKELSTYESTSKLLGVCVVVFAFMVTSEWARNRGLLQYQPFVFSVGALFLVYMVDVLRVYMRKNQVELLKEVKQVQLQVLELQESLRKDGSR